MHAADLENLTPMMRQWAEAKNEHKDAILLFRMGDFYELFGDDAVISAPILELALTSRDKDKSGLKMAGFPFHAAENYITKLIDAGHKVAICEQLENPKQKKGIVKRGISEVLTPGTFIGGQSPSYKNNFLLGLVVKGHRFAISAIDVATASFQVCSTSNEKAIIAEILRIAPSELVILANDTKALEMASMIEQSQNKCGRIRIEKLSDDFKPSTFQSGSEEEALAISLINRYLTLLLGKIPTHIQAPRRYSVEQQLLIDEATRDNLDLFPKKKGNPYNLFEVLNTPKTAMGKRALYQAILAPLTSLNEIVSRHEIVLELLNLTKLREEVQHKFSEIYDLAKLTSMASTNKITPRGLAQLRDSIANVSSLVAIVNDSPATNVKNSVSGLPDLSHVYKLLDEALLENPPINLKDGGIFKTGYNKELDDLYELSHGGQNKLLAIEEREKANTGISSLKVRYTRVFGYYIEVTSANLAKVPAHYQRKQTVANGERFVTSELNELELKLNSAQEAIVMLEAQLFDSLRSEVAKEASVLLHTAQIIALLDMLTGFAHVASLRRYIKPTMLDKAACYLSIESGRHPIAEYICEQNADYFVPNNVLLNKDSCSLALITGPNMAGKSTIMRQVALIQIMAQIGSFVPAASATLSITDGIFARVGASDDLATGRSTFMVEMSETAHILSSATPASLILLDEIGRGTSTYDGLAIAQAVIEYIHNEVKARTLFATHYHELTQLDKKLSRLKNFHVELSESDNDIRFLYTLAAGPAGQSFGIQVASLAGLPKSVLGRAKEILQVLEHSKEPAAAKQIKVSPQMNLFS